MTESASERRVLFLSPTEYEVGGIDGGNVGVRLRTAEVAALLPALDLVLRLSPAEARGLSAALIRWAQAIETGGERAE